MSCRVAARQLLLWTLRNATFPASSPAHFGRCHLQALCSRGRSLCSSSSQPRWSTQHNHEVGPLSDKPAAELPLRSLLDMGFTDTQAEQIQDAVSKIKGGSAARQALPTLTALLVLGLNASSVVKLLLKCPELYTVKESQLQQRIDNLRKLGLVEGGLQRVVTNYPQILTVPVKTVKKMAFFLREKCLFTSQQVTNILRDSGAIVLENMDQLEYKFQYVYIRMGVKQAEMVKSRLFCVPLDEVCHRHSFLERRGFYQTPDKKGQTSIINPKLETILNLDQDSFLRDVAMASADEYDVFKRLMAREWQEEQQQEHVGIEADSDDEEEEEGRSGYRKRRKK